MQLKTDLATTTANCSAAEIKAKRAANDLDELELKHKTAEERLKNDFEAEKEKWIVEKKCLENDFS